MILYVKTINTYKLIIIVALVTFLRESDPRASSSRQNLHLKLEIKPHTRHHLDVRPSWDPISCACVCSNWTRHLDKYKYGEDKKLTPLEKGHNRGVV